jgi:hypothetical protein
MSYIVTPFEVSSHVLAKTLQVRFVQLYTAIATRHSDTVDCVFSVDGQNVLVSISCPALRRVREESPRYFNDQQLVEMAARYLRRTLEQGYDPTQAELFIDEPQLRELGKELGYL